MGAGGVSYADHTTCLSHAQLHRHTQLPGAAITPLKKTPPRDGLMSLSSFLSPLADESANLSPAKPTVRVSSSSLQTHLDNSTLISQVSTGFVPALSSGTTTAASIPAAVMSDSSDSDSGSESDSESSDSEDQSSGEEENASRTDVGLKRGSIQSEEATPAPPFGSSTGFWDETYDLLGAASQVGEQRSKAIEQQAQSLQHELMETDDSATTSQSNEKHRSRIGKKRKQSSDSQFSLRKAQKLISMVQLSSDIEGESMSNQNPSSIMNTDNGEAETGRNLSESEMSEGDEEEGEIPSDGEESGKRPLTVQQTVETAVEAQLHNDSTNSSRANRGGANSSMSAGVKQEEAGEDHEEEPNSLVVRFQISSIPKLPLQKPKATVEPFCHHSTSTSKVSRRRNTVDAPGERDSDEVQPRGLSRERGDRSVYNRHREDYG